MKSEKLILETPYGTRDLLPEDAAEMRHVENNLSGLFRLWGYDEVVTPTIEHLETLVPRISEENSLFMLLGNQKPSEGCAHSFEIILFGQRISCGANADGASM